MSEPIDLDFLERQIGESVPEEGEIRQLIAELRAHRAAMAVWNEMLVAADHICEDDEVENARADSRYSRALRAARAKLDELEGKA